MRRFPVVLASSLALVVARHRLLGQQHLLQGLDHLRHDHLGDSARRPAPAPSGSRGDHHRARAARRHRAADGDRRLRRQADPDLPDQDRRRPPRVQTKVLHQGTGPVVAKNDLLVAAYLGQIWNGKVFDNSYDRKAPTGFTIGAGKVIPGWDSTLVGLKVGTRILMSIPPAARLRLDRPAAGRHLRHRHPGLRRRHDRLVRQDRQRRRQGPCRQPVPATRGRRDHRCR